MCITYVALSILLYIKSLHIVHLEQHKRNLKLV